MLHNRSRVELINEILSLRQENQSLKAMNTEYQYLKKELNENQQKLRLSEERLRLALANSPMVVFTQDQELRYTWLQNSTLGFLPEDVLGKTDQELFPEDCIYLTEIKGWVLKTGICFREELRLTNHGIERCCDLLLHPVFDKDGQVVGITGVAVDITGRKYMEADIKKHAEEMQESHQKMEQVIELLPNAAFVIDMEGQVVFWNKAMQDITGVSKEKMIGRGDYEYAIPFYGERRPMLLDLALMSNSDNRRLQYQYEFINQERDNLSAEVWAPRTYGGKGAYFLGSASTLYDLQGNLSGAIQTIQDITDRKQMEEALRNSEERFSKAFMVSPIPMSISRQEDGVYLYVNDSFLQAAGYSREEMIGRSSLDLSLWKDRGDRTDLLRRLQRGEKIREVEVKYCTKKGKGTVLVSMEPITLNETECIVTMLIDITERRQMEQDLARLDRLSLVGEMAASIGHEIRNPMTAVRGFIQLLSEQENYVQDRKYFDLMIEELDRANGIISEYLGMARDKVIDLQPQYLDQVIKAIYPMLEADANYKGMQIRLELGRPPMPLIDVKEIRQLILNMARNGFEAMAPYGTLTIGTTTGNGEIIMFIKDQGPGLADELLDKLGTPFVTTKDNGTGLGLAICYSIAARHKARIDFETSVEGTTFYVRFPLPIEQTS